MATAADDDQSDAPGASGTPPESTEIRTVHRFLDQFYEAAPLDHRVDAAAFYRALSAWADERTLPVPGKNTTYAAVRNRGIPVERGAQNVLRIHGLRPRPFAQHDLARLEGHHHHLQLTRSADREQRTMTHDLAAQARSLADEALAQLLPASFEALRAGLIDPDVRVRLQASEAVLSRCVPKVKVKETDPNVIDVPKAQARPSFAEVEAIVVSMQVGNQERQSALRESGERRTGEGAEPE